MYIVRDVFQLKFGHFRNAKTLIDEAISKDMIPERPFTRVLSDFTGPSYRLIFESGYKTLDEYEKYLREEMSKGQWREWYQRFVPHVESSVREILKVES